LDPQRATLFVQSHVAAHPHMARLLGGFASVGMLRRMIQFKEKAAAGDSESASLGLLNYPVLMAADILLYQADLVPVGEDQTQHLQLTRDLADRFNHRFGKDFRLKLPAPLTTRETARVMSLTDGRKKMSKSDSNDFSRINLLDPPELVRAKIRKAKTDAVRGLEFGNPERPEAHNLLTLYMVLSGKTAEAVAEECRDMQYGTFKNLLADAAVAFLAPIQARYHELLSDREELLRILREGAARASAVADATLRETSRAMGFLIA
jgi:tryptophanyl-tRNA synthetase